MGGSRKIKSKLQRKAITKDGAITNETSVSIKIQDRQKKFQVKVKELTQFYENKLQWLVDTTLVIAQKIEESKPIASVSKEDALSGLMQRQDKEWRELAAKANTTNKKYVKVNPDGFRERIKAIGEGHAENPTKKIEVNEVAMIDGIKAHQESTKLSKTIDTPTFKVIKGEA